MGLAIMFSRLGVQIGASDVVDGVDICAHTGLQFDDTFADVVLFGFWSVLGGLLGLVWVLFPYRIRLDPHSEHVPSATVVGG